MRRILALVLSVVMVLALPVMGFAASGSSSSGRAASGGAASQEGTTTQTLSDGTVVTTTTAADGTVTTVTTKPDGEVSAEADITTTAAEKEPVVLDVKAHADEDAEKASDVKVSVPGASGKVTVEVTVDQLASGVVVAQVMSDGSLKLVKTSTIGEKGLVFEAQGTATYKMLVNDKNFTDLTADWQKAGVDFVSSRELMVGTSEGKFSPDDEMTAAMMATVLGRLGDDVTTEETTGENWEDKALAWAKAEGFDVENADEAMTREQMMVMLYKYAGSPKVEGDLSAYADADTVTEKDAVTWCVNNGIIFGTSGSSLSVGSTATRAQFATVLMRYCELLNK